MTTLIYYGRVAALCFAATLVAACGGGGGGGGSGGSSATPPPISRTVNANVSKGPINGAQCTLVRASDNTILAGPVASNAGSVSFPSVTATGVLYVECTGGTYTDEATGSVVDATGLTLRAAKNIGSGDNIVFAVTPLTEIAVAIAESAAGGIAANADSSNALVADQFGLANVDITSVNPTDLNNNPAVDSAAGLYGTVLAAISLAAADTDGDGNIDDNTPTAGELVALINTLTNNANNSDNTSLAANTVIDEALANVGSVGAAMGNVDTNIANNIGTGIGVDPTTSDSTPSVVVPDLQDNAAQNYMVGSAIATLEFVNVGAQSLTECTADSLPAGLTIAVSGDASTCVLSGIPSVPQSATSHTITATNANGDDVTPASIDITVTLPLPDLQDASAQSYLQNSAIPPLAFVNSGGGLLSGCAADTLPDGLTVVVSADGMTCEISGTPTTPQTETNHTITATNATGGDATPATVSITVQEALAAPDLQDADNQIYTDGIEIPALDFVNIGGQSLTICTADSLPAGLSVSTAGGSCQIFGTPTAPQSATIHTITAINAAGSDSALVSITVNPALPSLANAAAQVYVVGNAITALDFVNSGGAVSSCSADVLPAGLSVGVSNGSCRITGTPTAPQAAAVSTITGTNATGSDTAAVLITVNPAAPNLGNAADQTYTVGQAITPLTVANSGGGSLTSCTASLPAGLSVAVAANGVDCEITGTPAAAQNLTSHTVTGANATGSDNANVNITVNPALPVLASPADQTYTVGSAIAVLTFANSGGGLLSSCAADTLPAGLSVTVSANGSDCEVSGTPATPQAATTHTITATNATGSAMGDVTITVNAAVLPDCIWDTHNWDECLWQ